MQVIHPPLEFHIERDSFVLWLRWVAMERPPSPKEPPGQGMRIELQLNRNAVFGPTIVRRGELEDGPLYLRANRERTRQVLLAAAEKKRVDVQVIVHGSVANAPFVGLYHLRDDTSDAISRQLIAGTPLIQLQPSVPAGQWQVAGQVNVRFGLRILGQRRRLTVLRSGDLSSTE